MNIVSDIIPMGMRTSSIDDPMCNVAVCSSTILGEPAKVARTLAVDFTTCEELVEKGALSPEDLKAITEHDATESSPGTGIESWGH